MDPAQLWQRYQEWLYHHEGLGLFLDISRIRFDSGLVESLRPKFVTAFSDMQALEAGAIANPDEHRQVGHYWLRSPHLAPRADITQAIKTSLEQIKSFAHQVHTGQIQAANGRPFTQLLWIGIGGSALGPQFVSQALAPSQAPLQIHFIDNGDPDGIDQVLTSLQGKLDQTLVAVVSKSGGTPEPNIGMAEIQTVFARVGLDFPRQAIAITGPGSPLQQRAQDWLTCFPIFEWVGGRTSELSPVGLVPAALQQIDIEALLAGAAEMDKATRLPDLQSNPAALLALAWYAAGEGRGRKDMVILPYKDRLMLLSRYLQQLVMESLGKALDLSGQRVEQGIAVYGNKGSTDQHAYVQQLRDGVNNFFVTFIEVLEDRQRDSPELEPGITAGDYLSGFLQGTRQALFDNQRDSITLTLPRVDPRRVGALIALYERAVGLYASLIHINAYHQPGVEAGKRAAASILALQRQMTQLLHQRQQPLTLQELAAALDQEEQIETLYLLIRHLQANHRHIQVQGDLSQPSTLKISARS